MALVRWIITCCARFSGFPATLPAFKPRSAVRLDALYCLFYMHIENLINYQTFSR